MPLQEPECESLECDDCALKEALSILQDALIEHEQTWGPIEAHTGDDDWATRAAVLLSARGVRQ
jgi:hypothetical protein